VLGLFTAIGLSVAGLAPLFLSLVVLLILILLFGIINPSEIRNGIDFDLILIIALGLALGKGIVNSGAAELVANSVVDISKPFGPIGLLAGIFLITNILASIITSKAAVAIILPIALSVSHSLNIHVEPFILIVAYGGAANFITPVGYQTNLMVYGPGGYNFSDFFKVGMPLTLLYLVGAVLVLSLSYGFL
ncbi:MAG: SLC13 family permease, partial [Flavobacteriales bacterium]